jgi:hypothetical protein
VSRVREPTRIAVALVLVAALAGVADHLALVAGLYASGAVLLAAVAVPAVLGLRSRGLAVPTGAPRPVGVAGLVAVGPGVVVLAALVVIGRVVPLVDLLGVSYPPRTTVWTVLARTGPTAAARGAAHALIACLVVHEPLRDRLDGAGLVAAVAGSALFARLFLLDAARSLSPASARWRLVAAAVLAVGTVALGSTLAAVRRAVVRRSLAPVYRPWRVVVYAPALFVAVAATTVALGWPEALVNALWVGAAAVAAAGYERTRSVWPPVLALAGVETALRVAPAV